MTPTFVAQTMKAVNWLATALVISFSVLFAGAFLGSGILTGKFGLVVCGIGWTLITVVLYYFKHPVKKLTRWSMLVGAIGVLVFLLGLAMHGGAL